MEADKNPWKVLSEKNIYDNNWINVTEYDVINPNGGKGIYGKVHFKNVAVAIVPLDENNNTYLVQQFRFTINQNTWEIPEGGGSFNESYLESAKRELLEETGLKAESWQQVLTMHLSNSVTDEFGVVYVAKNLTQHQPMPEETEQLKVKKFAFDKVYQMIESGEITDALTIMAIQKVKLLMLEEKL